jgi:hypothetical protein
MREEMSKFTGAYPPCWPLIEEGVGVELNYTCERCGHKNDAASHHVFTVHHLDNNKSNCARWNLAGLCQRCHLKIQGRVNMSQFWMFEHSKWMIPHVVGYYESLKARAK